MYDQATLELINSGPHFGGLDLQLLPKDFTAAYTEIVAARLRVHENEAEELSEIYEQVYSIASTYEAYVFLQDQRRDYKAAAFISASAHHLCSQIKAIREPELFIQDATLVEPGIDSRISGSILFFISGYSADASEMIRSVNISEIDSSGVRLLNSLRQLITGNIQPVQENQPVYPDEKEWGEDVASNALWSLLHEGVNRLLSYLIGESENHTNSFEEAHQIFDTVIELAVDDYPIELENIQLIYQPIFNSHLYLAKLVKILAQGIPEIALISVDTPDGLDINSWRSQLTHFSTKRPYLWFNHINAIQSGYLNPGVSSVVSFPTGGGKSTLSELKISTSLLQGRAVIFIAPTLALVDQVAKSLKDAFPMVTTRMSMEEFGLDDIEIDVLPDISVMTPESCLVRMSFNPELYENVGLFIFDECHLLSSKTQDIIDKRSIDSMLCLLRVLELSPDTDLLLMSAMMGNNEEISSWLSSLTDRTVLSLSMNWKPTRQAKGCVVYDSEQVQTLRRFILRDASRTNSNRLTAAAKRMLTADPYSFFSLNQTWHSGRVEDYKLVKLSDRKVILGVNDFDGLIANRNVVAASLAKDAIRNGIKTLIFATTKRECDSIVKSAHIERTQGEIVWSDYESELIEYIDLEFGGIEHSYADNESSGLQHHGLLTREERLLHESLFRRPDGVDLLVATSTLAQGMNLPAEYVIIAGNTRFDVETGQAEELDAHELLNAAGRAGRAGEHSTGVVLVIPSRVVSFDASQSRITEYWNEIKSVFSQSDQCLQIEDPLAHVLDKIQDNLDHLTDDIRYFIHRLPVDEHGTSEQFINRTFRAYTERQLNNQAWAEQRIEVANEAFSRVMQAEEDRDKTWHDQLSSVSGIPVFQIRQLHADLTEVIDSLGNVDSALAWYMEWLSDSTERIGCFLRIPTLEQSLGEFNTLNSQERCDYFTSQLLGYVGLWISGAPIRDIELAMGTPEQNLNKCEKARKFIIRVIPEISYSANILSQVYSFHSESSEEGLPELLHIKLLGRFIRIGVNSLEKYALHNILKNQAGRVKVNTLMNKIRPLVDDIENPDDLDEIFSAVGRAYRSFEQIREL